MHSIAYETVSQKSHTECLKIDITWRIKPHCVRD